MQFENVVYVGETPSARLMALGLQFPASRRAVASRPQKLKVQPRLIERFQARRDF